MQIALPQSALLMLFIEGWNFGKTRNTFCGMRYLPHSQVYNDQTVSIKISAIHTLNKVCVAYFSLCMRDTAVFSLLVQKSNVTIVFLDPNFL